MVTIFEKINLYNFSELSKAAKDVARDNYLDSTRFESEINEITQYHISYLLPLSDLGIEADANGYAYITGTLSLLDMLQVVGDKFTAEENNTLKYYITNCEYEVEFPPLPRYYNIWQDAYETAVDTLVSMSIREFDKHLLFTFFKHSKNYLSDLHSEINARIDDYFTKVEDYEIEDYCAENEYKFLENGVLHNYNEIAA